MRIEIFSEGYSFQLAPKVNKFLESLEESGKILVEIQYSSTDKNYSVMVIYCEKSHYRELRLGKLLDK